MTEADVVVPNTEDVMARHANMTATLETGEIFTLVAYLIKSNGTITDGNTTRNLHAGMLKFSIEVDNVPSCVAAESTNMRVRNRERRV